MSFWDRSANYVILNVMNVYGAVSRRRYLRISRNSDRTGEKLLLKLLKRSRNTEIGKKFDFDSINTAREYQNKIPFTTYDDYRDYLERTALTGEQRLITSDRISFFANTSGTTGVTKRIPVVSRSYKPYLNCASIFIWILKQELKRRGIKSGKGLNTIETEYELTPGGIRQGFISAYALSSAKNIIPHITCLPKEIFGYGDSIDMKYVKARYALEDGELVYMMSVFMSTLTDLMHYIEENLDMLINDIETGTIDPSVDIPSELRVKLQKKLRPNKKRADELRRAFAGPDELPLIPRIWPRMTLIVAIGTGEFTPFSNIMRVYCGEQVHFCYEMYAASEALFASALQAEDKNYLLIPDGGFFEFIPVDDAFDESTDRPLLMHELEVGKLYEIVVTSLAGLYRYRIKDVIRVTGFIGKTPLIQFGYRKSQLINITGVKLTIEHVTNAIKGFESRLGVSVRDYSLYPDTSTAPWHILAFMELEGTPNVEYDGLVSEIFDEELSKVNAEHGRMLKIGESSPSIICSVRKNTYRDYRDATAKLKQSGNQVKSVRFIDTPEKLQYFTNAIEKIYT